MKEFDLFLPSTIPNELINANYMRYSGLNLKPHYDERQGMRWSKDLCDIMEQLFYAYEYSELRSDLKITSFNSIYQPKIIQKYLQFKQSGLDMQSIIFNSKQEIHPRTYQLNQHSLNEFVDNMFIYTEQVLMFNFDYLFALFINIQDNQNPIDRPRLSNRKHMSYLLQRIPELQRFIQSKQIDVLEFQKQYKPLLCQFIKKLVETLEIAIPHKLKAGRGSIAEYIQKKTPYLISSTLLHKYYNYKATTMPFAYFQLIFMEMMITDYGNTQRLVEMIKQMDNPDLFIQQIRKTLTTDMIGIIIDGH